MAVGGASFTASAGLPGVAATATDRVIIRRAGVGVAAAAVGLCQQEVYLDHHRLPSILEHDLASVYSQAGEKREVGGYANP